MKLYIDSSAQAKIRLALSHGKLAAQHSFETDKNLSELLITQIEKFVKAQNKQITELDLIEVVTGPGPFSRIRTAVATANALAYGLKIKIKGGRSDDKQKSMKPQAMVTPDYDKQPNITKPKFRSRSSIR